MGKRMGMMRTLSLGSPHVYPQRSKASISHLCIKPHMHEKSTTDSMEKDFNLAPLFALAIIHNPDSHPQQTCPSAKTLLLPLMHASKCPEGSSVKNVFAIDESRIGFSVGKSRGRAAADVGGAASVCGFSKQQRQLLHPVPYSVCCTYSFRGSNGFSFFFRSSPSLNASSARSCRPLSLLIIRHALGLFHPTRLT